MKGKKIAVGVIIIVVIIVLLTSVPLPFLPVPLTPMEFLRYWLVYNFDIDIYNIVPTQKPEIDTKGKIAFSFITFAEEGKIYIGDVENKNIYLLAKDLRIFWQWERGDLAWSPDGQEIIFTGPFKLEQAGNNIYVLTMRGEIRRLTKLEGIRADTLSFSPDGKKILFTGVHIEKIDMQGYTQIGKPDIYIMNADGTNVKILVKEGAEPVWSPDGKKIVFTSYCDGGRIAIANADGSNVTLLVKGHSPCWLPDGKTIVFVKEVRDSKGRLVPQIFRIDISGKNLTQITNFSFEDFASGDSPLEIKKLSCAPDGKKIAFIIEIRKVGLISFQKGERVNNRTIYILNVDDGTYFKFAEGDWVAWAPS